MKITQPTTFSTADLTLSVENLAGSAGALHADATILVYDTTAVTSLGIADTAAVGSVGTSSRRDHLHGNLLAFTLARLYGH